METWQAHFIELPNPEVVPPQPVEWIAFRVDAGTQKDMTINESDTEKGRG